MAHGFGDEPVFAPGKVLERASDHRLGAPHVLDVLPPALDRGQRVEVGGIRVVPADVALVHRLRVVAQRSIVAAHVPRRGEALRQGEPLGDLGGLVPVVHEPYGLVVQVLVEVALLAEELQHARVAPHRPVMLGESDVGIAAEAVPRLVQVLRPRVGVAGLRAGDRIDVVQVVSGVLGEVQRPKRGVEHVHLGRRLGLRGELEDNLDAVDAMSLEGLPDDAVGGMSVTVPREVALPRPAST